jgi:hypothetical protein
MCHEMGSATQKLLSMLQPHFGAKCKMQLTLPKVGKWSLLGFPKIQKTI